MYCLLGSIDYDDSTQTKSWSLVAIVSDGAGPDARVPITVILNPLNEYTPTYNSILPATVHITEGDGITWTKNCAAKDDDLDPHDIVSYQMTGI